MSVADFNRLLLDFMSELVEVFPEVRMLPVYREGAQSIIERDPQQLAQGWSTTVGKSAAKIMQRDPTFFDDCPVLFKLDVRALWKKDLSDATRDVIWTYLAQLQGHVAASSLPQETMEKLQDVAKDVAGLVQSGTLDLSQLMSMIGMGGMKLP